MQSLAVAISDDGGASVVHKVGGGGEDRTVGLLAAGGGDAPPAGIRVVGADDGAPVAGFAVSEDGMAVVVPPTDGDVLIEYELEEAMKRSGTGAYSWQFLYRATTTFTLPDSVDVAFVNGQAVYFTAARAFNCHGCQMDLEFSVNEPREVRRFKVDSGESGEPRRFDVGVWTSAQVGALALDLRTRTIAYEAGGIAAGGDGSWVTLVVPLDLLGPPYQARLNGEPLPVTTFDAGGGRLGVSAKLHGEGTVYIAGKATAENFTKASGGGGGGAAMEQGGGAALAAILAALAGGIAAGAVLLWRRVASARRMGAAWAGRQSPPESHAHSPYSSVRLPQTGHFSP